MELGFIGVLRGWCDIGFSDFGVVWLVCDLLALLVGFDLVGLCFVF